MATPEVVPEIKKPGPPIPMESWEGQGIFRLRYKLRGICQDIHFSAKTKGEAIRIGKEWCDKHKAHFVYVDPFLFDLNTYTPSE